MTLGDPPPRLAIGHSLQAHERASWQVEPIVKQFEALDKDGNGRLNRADLEIISKTYRQRGSITGVDNAAATRLAESFSRSNSMAPPPKHAASDLSRVVSRKVSRMVSVSSVSHEVLEEEEQALQMEPAPAASAGQPEGALGTLGV